jgi:general secretion pathway protein H
MSDRHSLQPGFTLLETLVALALVAVLLAVAVPALVTSPGVELRAAADTLATGLRQARLEAQRRQRPLALQVDVEARTLQLEDDARQRQLPEDIQLELFTAEQEMLGPGHGGIRFYPDGSSTGGRVTLELAGLRTRVDVEWLTGRVRITADDS